MTLGGIITMLALAALGTWIANLLSGNVREKPSETNEQKVQPEARMPDASEITALISRSKTTADVIQCTQCDYSGIMIIKRRRNIKLLLLLLIPAIFLGVFFCALLARANQDLLVPLGLIVPVIIPFLVTSQTAVLCPKCSHAVRTTK